LVDYISTHYTSSNIVLAAAGGVDHQQLVDLAEKYFSNLPVSSSSHVNVSPCRYTGSEMRIRDDDMPFAHTVLAVEGCGWANPDYFPLMVASTIIGNWDRSLAGGSNMSSKLARVCSDENLAHSFMSFNTCYTDTGLWGMYMISDKMTIDDLMFNVQNEWMRICNNLSDFEVERAKNALKTSLFTYLDGSTPVCEDIGRQMLTYGRRIPPSELDYRIEQIDARVVKEVCTRYIYDKCPVLVGIGPIEQLPDYNRIRGNLYWFRT
jgi:processing peptidase subunit beta